VFVLFFSSDIFVSREGRVSCSGNGSCVGESCNGARSDVMPMAANGCQWLPMACQWLPMVANGLPMVANGLPMVANGCQWLPLTGQFLRSHVTSKSINNPVSSRRKWKLFSSQRHYFTLGSEEKDLSHASTVQHLGPLQRHSSTTYTVRDTTISDRLLRPLEDNSTNRLGQHTHIDRHDGYRRHRTLHGRHSPSSTR
jgi:hypothetical protein